MRYLPAALLLSVMVVPAWAAPVDPREPRPLQPQRSPKDTARLWFDAVAGGDVPGAMEVSAVPFFWDSKRVIGDEETLRQRYDAVLTRRGVRRLVPDRVEVGPEQSPDNVRYCGSQRRGQGPVVKFWIGKHHVGVCVVNERVVGFADS